MVSDRIAQLHALLAERILVLDGAMGTMIQRYDLDEAAYRGERFADWHCDVKGNNDLLVLTQPQIIGEIHRAYLDAGADIIETNTFSANHPALADYGMEEFVYEVNFAGARIARAAADEAARDSGRPRFVAGVLGPTNRTASLSPDVNDPGKRNITFDQLADTYADGARALIEGGADLLLVETIFDTLNAKAALFGIRRVRRHRCGCRSDDLRHHHRRFRPHAVGPDGRGVLELRIARRSRCWSGSTARWAPEELRPYVAELSRVADTHVSAHPNAGLPNAIRRVRRDARADGRAARRVGEERASERRRRLLRHDAGTRGRHRRRRGGVDAAPCPRCRSGCVCRASSPATSGRTPVRERRRAHQRHRLAGSPSSSRRRLPRGALGRAPAGGERRADHRRQHGRGHARLRGRDDHVPELVASEPDIARVPVMIDSSKWSVIEAGLKCVQGKAWSTRSA
jgi:5-methyltetrahydrofolate--homocysteine methyltransferase